MAQFYKPKRQVGKRKQPSNGKYQQTPLETTTLTVSTQDQSGQGICLETQPITIIENGLIGEVCEVRLSKTSKRVNYGYASKIVRAHEERISPFCNYYGQCGGCSMQHTSVEFALLQKNKALQSFLKRQHHIQDSAWQSPIQSKAIDSRFDPDTNDNNANVDKNTRLDASEERRDTKQSDSHGYRRRIRLAIDARNPKHIRIGFREKSSQNIIDISHCAIALGPINELLPALHTVLKTLPSVKNIGHIIVTIGEDTNSSGRDEQDCGEQESTAALQIALNVIKPLSEKSLKLLGDFAQEQQLAVVINSKAGTPVLLNTKSASSVVSLHSHIRQMVEAEQFLQVNPGVNKQMLETALAWLQPRRTQVLYDFFCGTGNFSLVFANRVKQVKGFEGVASMVAHAQQNAQLNGLSNCHFDIADLSDETDLGQLTIDENSLVILDPSREGAQALCKKLSTCKVAKILYVSCNPNSFDRDITYLSTRYRVEKIAALDMFPYTKHLELMALLMPL